VSNDIVPVDQVWKMAQAVAASNLFGMKDPNQAMALMLVAQAEGMHPALAARDYHIIQGRPALKADAMLARFQAAGGKVEWKKYTDSAVSAVMSHPSGGSVEIEWTIEMANRAGLTKNPTWRNYPRQMLRARVISEGIRTVFPGVAVGVYTPEEVQDFAPPKDVTPAPAAQSDLLKAILEDIAAAKTEVDLADVKPAIKTLEPAERQLAIQAGISRMNAIKAAPVDVPVTPAPETAANDAEDDSEDVF
jgi:hypothetical protein